MPQLRLSPRSLAIALGGLTLVALGLVVGVLVPDHSQLALEFAGGLLLAVLVIWRVEVAYLALIGVVVFGYGHGGVPVALALSALTIVAVLIGELARQRLLIVPIVIAIYCGWFLITATHSSLSSGGVRFLLEYLLPPLLAVATAAAARDPRVRRRIVIMLLAAAVIEAAFVYSDWFRGLRADGVQGTLGSGSANVLGLVMMIPATVFLALAIERVWRPGLMFTLALALAFCGVLSSSRAVFAFVPAAFGAVALSYGFSARRSRGARRALALVLPVAALAPLLVVVFLRIEPKSVGPLTSFSGIQSYLLQQHHGGIYPGKEAALKIAVDEAAAGGPFTALAGRGVGVTRATVGTAASTSAVSSTITATNGTNLQTFLTPEQETSGIWLGQILTETGWIGVATFLGLLGYLIVLGRRTRDRLPQGSLDRALVVALPGLAWLILLGSVYAEAFFIPSVNVFFWLFVGVCIAIARDARKPVMPKPSSP